MGIVALALILGSFFAKDIFVKNNITSYKLALERPAIGYSLKSDESNDEVTYGSNHNVFTSVSIGTKYFDIGFATESQICL